MIYFIFFAIATNLIRDHPPKRKRELLAIRELGVRLRRRLRQWHILVALVRATVVVSEASFRHRLLATPRIWLGQAPPASWPCGVLEPASADVLCADDLTLMLEEEVEKT